jgi:hypothetical protein
LPMQFRCVGSCVKSVVHYQSFPVLYHVHHARCWF